LQISIGSYNQDVPSLGGSPTFLASFKLVKNTQKPRTQICHFAVTAPSLPMLLRRRQSLPVKFCHCPVAFLSLPHHCLVCYSHQVSSHQGLRSYYYITSLKIEHDNIKSKCIAIKAVIALFPISTRKQKSSMSHISKFCFSEKRTCSSLPCHHPIKWIAIKAITSGVTNG
jgi:hypothetical protein